MRNHLPTSSCQRSFWMPPYNGHPIFWPPKTNFTLISNYLWWEISNLYRPNIPKNLISLMEVLSLHLDFFEKMFIRREIIGQKWKKSCRSKLLYDGYLVENEEGPVNLKFPRLPPLDPTSFDLAIPLQEWFTFEPIWLVEYPSLNWLRPSQI